MAANIRTMVLEGIDAHPVDVEVDFPPGLPATTIVGLASTAVREARDRVVSAITNIGCHWPSTKTTVNLAPADRHKDGSAFDLPIAVGVLVGSGQVPGGRCRGWAFVGELSLDGRLRPVPGIVSMAMACRDLGMNGLIVPEANGHEARFVDGIDIYTPGHLREIVEHLRGEGPPMSAPSAAGRPVAQTRPSMAPDLAGVVGQASARRALEISAAGGHNLLLVGPPGVGKSLLAACMPGILPPMESAEALEVTRIHSVVFGGGTDVIDRRPFRAPHHTITPVALVGGGARARPGEITLAHRGVLFLDELAEFRRSTLDLLRQPMEDGRVEIARLQRRIGYPARFTLVGATNPCPCGDWPASSCKCSPHRVRSYQDRLSGPLLDRFDLCVHLSRLTPDESILLGQGCSAGSVESSRSVRERVIEARARARQRLGRPGAINGEMGGEEVRRWGTMDRAAMQFLRRAVVARSPRAVVRVLRCARTIADLAGSETVQEEALAEAVTYRFQGWEPL